MKEVLCEGSIILRFGRGEVKRFLDAMDAEFDTQVREGGKDPVFSVFAALYHASQDTCMLIETYENIKRIPNDLIVKIKCGKCGPLCTRKIDRILKAISPYTVRGEVKYAGIDLQARHIFTEEGWEYHVAKTQYSKAKIVANVA